MATEDKPPLQHPQVFINFRGNDLRQSFISHLEMALKKAEVNVYVQTEQPIDGVPLEILFKGLEESSIALAIFSKRYTESSWCLNELVKIQEQVEQRKLVALPIFYKLDPSEVKSLEGDFSLNLWNHVKRTSEFDKLKEWKQALDFVSREPGFVFTEKSNEMMTIANIVDHVKREARRLKQDENSDVNPNETDSVKTEVDLLEEVMVKDDKLNCRKDETECDTTSELQNIKVDPVNEEKKQDHVSGTSTMVAYNNFSYNMFISFRGGDLHDGFLSFLKRDLNRNGVNAYVEEDELREKDLGNLFKRIQESKIALVIFSSRYAKSTWCLDELVKIKERMDNRKLRVIPVFFKVEPLQVRTLKGDFGAKFWNMWRITRSHHIIKWKQALKSVASMDGIYLEEHGSESDLIKEVLERISQHEGDNPSLFPSTEKEKTSEFQEEKHENYLNKCQLFGMEQRMEQLEKKLEIDCNNTRIVGVVGMPGIGKTTLTRMLHEKWNRKFIRCVPLLGIPKMSEKFGPEWLQTTLREVLLEEKYQELSEEPESVKFELLKTKIFAILDDVSDKKQLELLLGDRDWIKKGSKIVITTSDLSLLKGFVHDTYVVPELNDREAFQLFSYHAFNDQICSPSDTLLKLSREFVDYARGHPLTLRILGMELAKDEAHLEYKLETVTRKVQYFWRMVIDQLNEKQKDVFLDIVCFFKSENEYFVRSLLDSGDSEVRDLANKFLITISDGRVDINVPPYTSGMDSGSLRWEANNVRGIFLNMSKFTKSIILNISTFINMHNLRYLKIYDSSCSGKCEVDCNICIPDGLEFPLKEVRYLHWVKFPLKELPPDFRPENLVDLRLPYSKIERVLEGVKDTPRLKWVDLSHSSKLVDVSALSKAENLLTLSLEGCTSLCELPVDIQSMKSLYFLNLRGCTRLRFLPKMNLISLKILILSDCTNLKNFQLISESLEVLHLDGTALEELPSAIKKLQRLVLLNLKNCKLLKFLPKCLGELKSLEELILSGCSKLTNISHVRDCMKHLQSLLIDRIGAKEMPHLSCVSIPKGQASADMIVLRPREYPRGANAVCSLTRLCLSGNDFVSLKPDIGKLYNLNWLDLKECKMLTSIPMLPPRLQYFDAHGCDSLQTVANPLALPVLSEQVHAKFYFSNCNKLDQDAKDNIISYTCRKSQLVLDATCRYNEVSFLEGFRGTCFPGGEIPPWFCHQAPGPVLNPKLPPHWCDNNFTGIVLCAVILFPVAHEQLNRVLVKCNYEFTNQGGPSIRYSCTVGGWSEPSSTPRKIESSHVFIGFTSRLDIKGHTVEDDEENCGHIESSFEFQVTNGTKVLEGYEVLKCGLYLVYATGEREDISWDAKTVVTEEYTENIPIEERSSRNSVSYVDIMYESDSGLIIGRDEILFSEGKSDASTSIHKSIGNERVDLLNEESIAGEASFSSYHNHTYSGLLEKLKMLSLVRGELEVEQMSKDLGSRGPHSLRHCKDIIEKLTKMKQLEANKVRGILLDMSDITESVALERMIFTYMQNLLYLTIYDSRCPRQCKADGNIYFPDGLESPLEKIRYLDWMKLPLEELPSDFKPVNLVNLRLCYSNIRCLWRGVKDTRKLKWVDLSHSSKLLELSALSKAENLQRLNLEGCTSLDKLPVEIQNMKSLVFLNMRGCIRLMSFPKMNIISLKTLILSDCSNLKEFPQISESLEFLHLDGTAIKEIPPAIENLQSLIVLSLINCTMLECLPNCIGKLKALDELILSGCSRLENLPDVQSSLKHLQTLLLDGTGVKEMPSIPCFTGFEGPPQGSHFNGREWPCGTNGVSFLQRLCLSGNDFVNLQPDIKKIYNLKWLDLKHCKKLICIPTLPPRLQYFDAHGCESLETVANPLAFPVLSEQIHATFNFSECNKLVQDAKDSIMSYTRLRSQLVLDELTRYNGGFVLEALTGTCFPGWEVPSWFSHRASGSMLETKIFPHWYANGFTGVALCAVIVFHGGHDQRKRVLVKCNCEFKNEDGSSIQFTCTVGGWNEPSNAPQNTESNHVFIGYTSTLDINKHSEEDNKEVCTHTEASFEFQVTDGTEVLEGFQVLKCGFNFLHATDELRVEAGVHGDSIREHHRNNSKNVVISNIRGDIETAERSPDGECKIVELPNNMIAGGNATTPKPGFGIGSNNLELESHVGASTDTLSSMEPRNVNLIPVVASSSQDGLQQTYPRVFISFHGATLYKSFVSKLVSTLRDVGLNAFTGNHTGNEIRLQKLYKRIKKSKIALVIFSQTYLNSKFCLNELLMVKKLAEQGKLLVIPVFYDVRLIDVKYLEGEFGRCFKELRRRFTDKPEKVLKWETSVKSIAGIMGICSEVHGKDAHLIDAIVEAVQEGLNEISGGNRIEGYTVIIQALPVALVALALYLSFVGSKVTLLDFLVVLVFLFCVEFRYQKWFKSVPLLGGQSDNLCK